MAGLFSRLKTWVQDEKLLSSDLNAEFNNIINNAEAVKQLGASKDLVTMQATENPGGLGSEVYGTGVSTADEIERLRFVTERLIGGSKRWYEAPPTDLSALNSFLSSSISKSNSIISGTTSTLGQPTFLRPSASGRTAVVKGSNGSPLKYSIVGVAQTPVTADITSPVASAPPSSNNTAVVTCGDFSDPRNLPNSTMALSSVGSSITALTNSWVALKIGSEPVVGFLRDSVTLENVIRYGWFDSAGAPIVPVSHTGATATLMRLFFVFLTSTQTVEIYEKNPVVSGTAPGGASVGDLWFDLAASSWKKWDGAAWTASNSLLVGMAMADATDCIAARSVDFTNPFSSVCENDIAFINSTTLSTRQSSLNVNVYGSAIQYPNSKIKWTTSLTVLEGGSVQPATVYGLYISNLGEPIISTHAPADRRDDLGGYYHIYAPYRAIGCITTDGGSAFSANSIGSFHFKQATTATTSKDNYTRFDSASFTLTNGASYTTITTLTLLANRRVVTVALEPSVKFGGGANGICTMFKVTSTIIQPSGVTNRGTLFELERVDGNWIPFVFTDDLGSYDEAAFVTYTLSGKSTFGATQINNFAFTAKGGV